MGFGVSILFVESCVFEVNEMAENISPLPINMQNMLFYDSAHMIKKRLIIY